MSFYNPGVNVIFRVAGFRHGRRGPFVSARGPKTIDAPSGLIHRERTPTMGRAVQLAGLTQGPPGDKGVPF